MATNNSINNDLSAPTIANVILDVNGNILIDLSPIASAVNYIDVSNNVTTAAPAIGVVGSDTNISFTLTSKGTGGVAVRGHSDGSSADSGYVGELISSVIASGTPVSFSNGISKDLTSISLPAGDWDLQGNINFQSSGAFFTSIGVWMSLTSATEPDDSLFNGIQSSAMLAGFLALPAPYLRVNVTTTTTVYLSGFVGFGSGTATGSGGIYARRVR